MASSRPPAKKPGKPTSKRPAKKTVPGKPPAKARQEPWERLDAETDPAWSAFITYRDMGLNRSTAKVAREVGKSKQLMDGWSSKHSWVLRVKAYDAHVDREWRNEQAEARREAARNHAEIGNAALVKFGDFLDTLSEFQLEVEPAVYVKLAEVGLKLVRDGIGVDPGTPGALRTPVGPGGGLPRHPGDGGQALGGHPAATLPDEDRRTRLLMLRRELDTRLEDEPVPEGSEPDPDDPYAED